MERKKKKQKQQQGFKLYLHMQVYVKFVEKQRLPQRAQLVCTYAYSAKRETVTGKKWEREWKQ